MWQVIEDGDLCHVRLRWSTSSGKLTLGGACIQDVRGLNNLNKQLLEQRGAVGEPVHQLREASKKVIDMASAVSKLKQLSDRKTVDPSLAASLHVEQGVSQVEPPEQQVEQDDEQIGLSEQQAAQTEHQTEQDVGQTEEQVEQPELKDRQTEGNITNTEEQVDQAEDRDK
jgi:hypothetical protein